MIVPIKSMNFPTVIKVSGHLLIFLSFILILPASLAWYDGSGDFLPFLISMGLSFGVGLTFWLSTFKCALHMSPKEGFGIVTLSWLLLSLFGAFPFMLTEIPGFQFSFIDAYFETMSGLTTTGASILSDIESLPRGLLLWRSLTHWIGGMGVIVLFLAILPALGAGGFQLFRAEIPGPNKDKISPKIGNTAKTLWLVYLGLTVLCCVSLKLTGEMGWFDSLCHTFGTVATGGFSTKNTSVAFFSSARVDVIITIFMFLSGCNFMLFLFLIKGRWKKCFQNEEFKTYTGLIVSCILILTLANFFNGNPEGLGFFTELRHSAFQTVSIMTSTGFATYDYNLWPPLCQLLILVLMFIGASAGSTGGGMKVFRILIIFKTGIREIYQLIRPRAVLPIKMDDENLGEELVRVVLGFVCLYFIVFGIGSIIIVALEGHRYNILSLVSICISCLSNIGPGLDQFGPTENYSSLGAASKGVLTFMMLLGRLELYSVLVLFHKDIWRK